MPERGKQQSHGVGAAGAGLPGAGASRGHSAWNGSVGLHGAAGAPRRSRLLHGACVHPAGGLELSGLLLARRPPLHVRSPEPRQGFRFDSLCIERKENALGVSRATSLSLGLLTWDERSSLPLFCPSPSASTVPDVTPPPIAWV